MASPTTDWKEVVPDDEEAKLVALAEALRDIQLSNAKQRPIGRALHYKQHAGVMGTLRVFDDLPEHCRHGLFAQPHTHHCYLRFSNGSPRFQRDTTGDVRGIAIKVLGVEGTKIIEGLEDALTQDFLFIDSRATPFRDAYEFVAFVVAASKGQLLLLPRFASQVGWGRAVGLVRKLLAGLKEPFDSFAGRAMFSALPFRAGPYAVRAALLPATSGAEPRSGRSRDPKWALLEDLADHLAAGPLAWDLALQFFVDEAQTPIEDASVDWSEDVAPWVRVARLEVPKQDLRSDEGKRLAALVDTLSFDPWHALVEHRPLGNMMRARNHAYRLSTMARKAAPEPTNAVVETGAN